MLGKLLDKNTEERSERARIRKPTQGDDRASERNAKCVRLKIWIATQKGVKRKWEQMRGSRSPGSRKRFRSAERKQGKSEGPQSAKRREPGGHGRQVVGSQRVWALRSPRKNKTTKVHGTRQEKTEKRKALDQQQSQNHVDVGQKGL